MVKAEIIKKENVSLRQHAEDWKEAMWRSGDLLVESNYITKDYIKLTIECVEINGPYIVLVPGLALSHSRPDVSVLKTGISLITLDEAVCFDCENDPVDIVITLAATDESSHLDILQVLADFLCDEENLDRIRSAETREQIVEMLNEFKVEA